MKKYLSKCLINTIYCWGNVKNSSKKSRKPVGPKTRWKNYSSNYWKLSKSRQHQPSIKIKEIVKEKPIFDFPEAITEDRNKIIKSLNSNKATDPDRMPLKIIKTAANVTDSHLAYIINKDLKENKCSENAKTALVRHIYKKYDRGKINNYRPVSLLNGFSKMYERFLHDSLFNFTDKILSKFVSAYRKPYGSNRVLLKLIEEWKKSLDDKNIIGAVLMYLSKAFDSIPHDLLMAKLYTFGLYMDAITFIYSYMKRRKQGVKIKDTESLFKIFYQEYLKDPS